MGLLIGGAVFPTAFCITWKKQTRLGAISGCIVGLAAGITAWLTTAKQYYGELTVATTGREYPTLAGNLAAIMTGLIVTVVVSLIKPDDFDWEVTRSINTISVTHGTIPDGDPSQSGGKEATAEEKNVEEKKASSSDDPTPTPTPAITASEKATTTTDQQAAEAAEAALHISFGAEDEPSKLQAAFKLACIASFVLTFVMDFLVPMPMFFSGYIFSKGFFTAWVVISFMWVFGSAFVSCFLPIWETRGSFGGLAGRIGGDVFRRGRG